MCETIMKRSLSLGLVALLALAGCKDDPKAIAQKAADQETQALALNDANVAKVKAGLVQGAEKLRSLYANGADPHQDPPAVRAALFANRAEVPELNAAKTTFSALVDANGIGVRNDLEQDAMAGRNVGAAFPALKSVISGFTTTTGAFDLPGPPAPPNRQWIGVAPVTKPDGSTGGLYIAGWTYRQYAYLLQDTLRARMEGEIDKAKSTAKVPIFYVMIFDASGVYGTTMAPDVNEKAMSDLDLLAKTAAGPAQGVVNVSDRDYGWAAARAPSLGANIGIVTMRSDL